MTGSLAHRLKKVLPWIVHCEQSVLTKRCQISDMMRKSSDKLWNSILTVFSDNFETVIPLDVEKQFVI